LIFTDDLSVQPGPRQARAVAFAGGSIIDREEQDFPSGTVCDRESRESRIEKFCCNCALFETMADAFYELSSSPSFGYTAAGSIASLTQKRAQNRFDQSFEVFVSQDNFAIASYGVGDEICKYRERGFVALAYATPVQYDISRTEDEEYFSSISSRDNLGATETSLPGQRSKCCSLPLFEVMQSSYLSVIERPDFDPYNTRFLARTMQYAIEERLQLSFEIVVSTDDFAMAHSYLGDNVCKFRIDRYHILAYANPVQYPIHTNFYEDSGPAVPLDCPLELTAVSGKL
ncbi:ground-like domain protein, partial [Cooperia oncophora]